jgi:hypothetical protein
MRRLNLIEIDNQFRFEIIDGERTILSSSKISSLSPNVKSSYNYAWEACRDGRAFAEKNPLMRIAYDAASGYAEGDLDFTDATSIKELSEAEFIQMNYLGILKTLSAKTKGSKGDERNLLHESLTSFIYEIGLLYEKNEKEGKKEEAAVLADLMNRYKRVLSKEFNGQMADIDLQQLQGALNPQEGEGDMGGGLPGMASSEKRIVTAHGEVLEKFLDAHVAKEVVEDYACAACQALQDYSQTTYDLETGKDNYFINIYEVSGEKNHILTIRVNRHLNVDNIIPVGEVSKIFPFHSYMFYQKYWKPIVESIGHFYIDDFDIIIIPKVCNLPDAPRKDELYSLDCWCAKDQILDAVEISFKGDPMIWLFERNYIKTIEGDPIKKEATSRYTEQDYAGSIVQCVDKSQPSLFGEMGEVIQVIPEDVIEIDVRFMNLANTDKMQVSKEERPDVDIDGLVVRLTEDQVIIIDDSVIPDLNIGV